MKKLKYKIVSFTLKNKEQMARLDSLAYCTGKRRGEIINLAVEAYYIRAAKECPTLEEIKNLQGAGKNPLP